MASPFSKAFAIAMALEAFPMIAPASAGNPPYSLCNTSRTKTRSQPIGYTSGTGRTSTPAASVNTDFTFSIKSG